MNCGRRVVGHRLARRQQALDSSARDRDRRDWPISPAYGWHTLESGLCQDVSMHRRVWVMRELLCLASVGLLRHIGSSPPAHR
jgi:hypothetical protein